MAEQRAKSALFAKYGANLTKASEAHAAEAPAPVRGGDIPPKVEGIAKLTRAWFAPYETGDYKGEFYFMAMGTAVTPEFAVDPSTKQEVRVAGKQTKIGPMAVCATKDRNGEIIPMDENVRRIQDEMKRLLLPAGAGAAEAAKIAKFLIGPALESTAELLTNRKPHFRYRTWQGKPSEEYPDPQVKHVWEGLVKYEAPVAKPGAGVKDGDGGNGQASAPAPRPSGPGGRPTSQPAPRQPAAPVSSAARGAPAPTRGAAQRVPSRPVPVPAPEEEPAEEPAAEEAATFDEFGDLDSLLEQAVGGDDTAQQTLTDMAIKAGVPDEDLAAMSWEEMVSAIEAGAPADESAEEPPAEGEEETSEEQPEEETAAEGQPWEPMAQDVYMYTLIDPRTKKPAMDPKTRKARKPVEIEVVNVDKRGRTVTAKKLDDDKVIVGADNKPLKISWDSLESAS